MSMKEEAYFVGGPWHLRRQVREGPPPMELRRMPDLGTVVDADPYEPIDPQPIKMLTYKPRKIAGVEVWVLEDMSDRDAMDMLITSAFSTQPGHIALLERQLENARKRIKELETYSPFR